MQNIEYVCELTNAIEQISQKYGDKDKLTPEEELVFKGLFEVLFVDDETKIYDVLGFYLEQLEFLNIDKKAKEFCKNRLILMNDMFVYVNYDDESNYKSPQKVRGGPETGYIWNCTTRDCVDCCINYKLNEVYNGNLVDKLLFLADFVRQTAQFAVSCGWDCHVLGNKGNRKDIFGLDDFNKWWKKYSEICRFDPTLNIKILETIE